MGHQTPKPGQIPANSGLSAEPGADPPVGLGTASDAKTCLSDTRKAQNQQRASLGLAAVVEAVEASNLDPAVKGVLVMMIRAAIEGAERVVR